MNADKTFPEQRHRNIARLKRAVSGGGNISALPQRGENQP